MKKTLLCILLSTAFLLCAAPISYAEETAAKELTGTLEFYSWDTADTRRTVQNVQNENRRTVQNGRRNAQGGDISKKKPISHTKPGDTVYDNRD